MPSTDTLPKKGHRVRDAKAITSACLGMANGSRASGRPAHAAFLRSVPTRRLEVAEVPLAVLSVVVPNCGTTPRMPSDNQEDQQFEKLRKAIQVILRDAPAGYDSLRRRLRRLNDVVCEETAIALQPALNERVQRMPHATYEEKKELSRWLNAELREFGLAIECPKTGQPTLLHANPTHDAERGRFRLDRMDDQHRFTTTLTSTELPIFKLRSADIAVARHRASNDRSI